MRMRVYIAGPYTHPDPVVNTRNAILAGDEVANRGHIPFIPHLNHIWHLVCPHKPDFWYEYDIQWLPMCDVLLRLPGKSWGADREIEIAKEKAIRVIYDIADL